ncbi:MAG TPA: hypothetical protein VFL83_03830 [Anaeromyxobacter sp.]|nr:hypothetical protein [Anaeromyxobacter sp.]
MRLLRSLAVASVAAAAAAGSAAEPRDRRPEFTTRTDEVVALGQVLSGSASAAAAPGETAGQEAVVALGETAPVSSVAVDVDVRFDHPYGLARVVVVDRGGAEHLVYETYPALEDGDRVQARGVCEETCQVAALAPAELRVQAVGARVAVHRLLLGHASLPDDPGARRRAQAAC